MSHTDTLREALRCGQDSCSCRSGRNTHCPSHDDGQPSLTLDERDGNTLFNCKTGCSQQQVIEALAGRGLWPVPDKVTPITRAKGEPDHLYRYISADGELVGEKGRWNGPPKRFAWRKPDERWGETSIPMDSMPLYNLADVLSKPEEPVWFVEGEKAVQACQNRGMVAVCLPGGASQQRFGNALDVLKDRAVILWPDNDEPGQGLMARLAGLLPNAQFVRPTVPDKGDAHDYFAQGGTVDALHALLMDGQPVVRSLGSDSVEVVMPHPGGTVTFTFSEMSWTSRATDARMAVDVRVDGVSRSPFSTRINLGSSSAREGIRRELEQVFGKTPIPWASFISTACSEADETWKSIDLSLDLATVEASERKWFLSQRVPAEAVTIMFGMGGSCKSLLALDMAIHALMDATWLGIPMEPVKSLLVIDYEDQPDEWRIRVESICKANGWEFPEGRFRYLPGNAIPVHEQAQRIRKLVVENEVGLVIVDSASSASGGELLDTPTVSKIVNFLQTLGVTTLMTAHNTKSEDTNYPYGSIQWHNLVRSTHYVEQHQEEGSRTAYVTIWNRKANRGKQRPLNVIVEFPDTDDGPITIEPTDEQRPMPTEDQSPLTRVMNVLDEPKTYQEIADLTGIPYSTVQRIITRQFPSQFTVPSEKRDGKRLVALSSNRPQLVG